MRTVTITSIALCAGLALAQSTVETRTTTSRTTLNGALVDATCQMTKTERTSTAVGQITRTESSGCTPTAATTAFGLVTADGRFVRFDDGSNARVVQIVRTASGFVPSDRGPLWVNASGSMNGEVAIVETLVPANRVSVAAAQTVPVATDVIFDVTHDGDRGKLIVSESRVTFEDISNSSHSRSWAYSDIKEFKRDGRQLKIEGHHGSSHDFKTEDRAMSEAIYNEISNRIVAARRR
jgi:hypothetical protein